MEAVIRRIASRWPDEVKWTQIESDRPQEWLNTFGYMALKWILREENIFVGRTAIAEGELIPEAQRIFQTMASEPIQKLLADKLRHWTEQKAVSSADPARDAGSFFDLVLAGAVSRKLYKADRLQTTNRMKDHVEHAVNLFLHGIQQ
jgi:TetR/AcrR family transcriptional regulator, mexJK operon transcriptional repressor